MTIYLAICDDNIADRKQLERLLEREKDLRLKNDFDVLYIDSFGSEEALMKTPIKYDMFFIDMTDGNNNGMELAKKLRKKGITAPIVLCSSSIKYNSYVNAPKELIFLEKPLSQGQITHLVDVAFDWTKNKTPLIEIKCQKDTYFLQASDIVRASYKRKFLTEISLENGTYIEMIDTLDNLFKQIEPHKCFVHCGKDVINLSHIKARAENGFYLTNEDLVNYNFFQRQKIINALTDYICSLRPVPQ